MHVNTTIHSLSKEKHVKNMFPPIFSHFSYILKYLGIKVFSMTDVDHLGIARVMEETCDHMFSK